MNILFLSSFFDKRINENFYNVLNFFSKENKVTAICYNDNLHNKIETRKNLVIKFFKNNLLYRLIFLPFKIYNEIDNEKIETVIIHNYGLCINSILMIIINIFINAKVKIILEIHHIEGFYNNNLFSLEKNISQLVLYYFKNKKGVKIRFVNKDLYRHYKDKGYKNIFLVYSMYTDKRIYKKINVTKIWDLVFISRLHKNKDIDLLIKIIIHSIKKKSDLKVAIVGDGNEKRKILRLINNFPINIDYYERFESSYMISKIINMSKFLIITSCVEGGPRTFIESLFCKTKIISTNVGLLKEFESKNIIKFNKNNFKKIINNKNFFSKYKFYKYKSLNKEINKFSLFNGLEAYQKFVTT